MRLLHFGFLLLLISSSLCYTDATALCEYFQHAKLAMDVWFEVCNLCQLFVFYLRI